MLVNYTLHSVHESVHDLSYRWLFVISLSFKGTLKSTL